MGDSVEPFRILLVKLSDGLSTDNVKRVKFLAGLGDAVSEQCKDAIDVFKELQRLGKITPNSVEFLKALMEPINRLDLITLIGVL